MEPQNTSGYASFNQDFLFAIMQNISWHFLFKNISLFDNITYNCIHSFFMSYAKKIETQERCFRIICRMTFRQNIAVGQNVVGFGSPLKNPFKYVARLAANVYYTK